MAKKTTRTRRCLVCKTKLEVPYANKDGTDYVNSPVMDGCICFTYGNYGSTVWDAIMMGRDLSNVANRLNFVICDKCILRNSRDIFRVETNTHVETTKVQTFADFRKEEAAYLATLKRETEEEEDDE